jgi:hypothetical protein
VPDQATVAFVFAGQSQRPREPKDTPSTQRRMNDLIFSILKLTHDRAVLVA